MVCERPLPVAHCHVVHGPRTINGQIHRSWSMDHVTMGNRQGSLTNHVGMNFSCMILETMKVISVNVGLPSPLRARDRVVESGILKKPIAGPVRVRTLNLDGDGQADLRVHGGVDKAVYAYPAEHYDLWQEEL